MDNIIIELTPERANWFVLCEKERVFIQQCLEAKSKIEKVLNFKQANLLKVVSSSIVIDADPAGSWHNIKVILNEHY